MFTVSNYRTGGTISTFNAVRWIALILISSIYVGCRLSHDQPDTIPIDVIVVNPVSELKVEQTEDTSINEIAWIASSIVVLLIDHDDTRILVAYDHSGNFLKELKVDSLNPGYCAFSRIRALTRLPNGHLGFVSECRGDSFRFRPISHFIMELDIESEQTRILAQFNPSNSSLGDELVHPGDFSFTNDLRTLIAEIDDDGINNRIVKLDALADSIEYFEPSFARAGSPTWVYGDTALMFAGNGSSNRNFLNKENDPKNPWNIYQYSVQDSTVIEVFSGIHHIDLLKWAPTNQRFVSFRGKIDESFGLWILDTKEKQTHFIWPESPEGNRIFYDWAPSGNQLVLLDCQESETEVECNPVIFDISFNSSTK